MYSPSLLFPHEYLDMWEGLTLTLTVRRMETGGIDRQIYAAVKERER